MGYFPRPRWFLSQRRTVITPSAALMLLAGCSKLSAIYSQRVATMPNSLFVNALRREIIILLLIKIILLICIKVAFFSAPPTRGPDEQAQHLLGVALLPMLIAQGGLS